MQAIVTRSSAAAIVTAQPIGLRLCGIVEDPPRPSPVGSDASATSFCMSRLTSRAILPREPVNFASSIRAALIAAIGFELFKLVASIYLKSVLRSPAGATFGPVLGLMVLQLLGDETLAARWRDIPDALADLLLPGLLPEAPKGDNER